MTESLQRSAFFRAMMDNLLRVVALASVALSAAEMLALRRGGAGDVAPALPRLGLLHGESLRGRGAARRAA